MGTKSCDSTKTMATSITRRRIRFLHMLLLFCFEIHITGSQSIIKHLPGFSGNLPFELETGYVSVDKYDDAHLFYYFIKSEKNPKEDPLVLWIDGGPGCSALCGFTFEIGPLNFVKERYNGSLPRLVLNPYSWTKVSNVIFLDSPVGAGYSYARTLDGALGSDEISAQQVDIFLRKWLTDHPDFLHNPLYIAGLSYIGMVIPVFAQAIVYGNEAGKKPFINFKGYVLGNPGADRHVEENSQVPFALRMGLISEELYESAKENCHEEYSIVDPSNIKCLNDIQAIKVCISGVNTYHILDPVCLTELIEPDKMSKQIKDIDAYPTLDNMGYAFGHVAADCEDEYSSRTSVLPSLPNDPVKECLTYGYKLVYYWANSHSVQEALHVRQGTIEEWIRCRLDIPYEKQFTNTVNYHLRLNTKGYRSLIYNGDHDLMVPLLGTQKWIKSLNFSILNDWRPWYVNKQVAGYTRTYSNNLTYATVKGGGHEVPMYKPKECLAMFERWVSHSPL